ncbi:restriction endonuclease subunit S [Paenibacillus sp. sgz500992]|uniref:restriction endonuclease subunit S n=1 Tax=Paenibacillus sp. sgz500992 TaxID=3242476 RepID=UPI0036D30BD7
MTTFKQTKLIDVLYWIPGIKRVKPIDIAMYRIESDEKYPFFGQSLTNNGIIEYMSIDSKFLNNVEKNVYLLVASNNHSINIVTEPFYLKEDHAATSIIGHEKMTLRTALYIKSSIFHVFAKIFDYNAKATQDILKNTVVTLPFISESDNELDWEFMERSVEHIEKQSVEHIEKQYVERIEGYLLKLGYSSIEDTLLSYDDKAIIEKYSSANVKPFKLEELFDTIKRGKRIKSLDRIVGELPFITAGVEKMGFSDYIGNFEAEVFPANSLTIDMFGITFYRGYKFGADDHVTVLHRTDGKFSRAVLQFIQPNINSAIAGKFSYSRNFYASDAPEVEIKLPVTLNGEIDYELIENYITIIQKKVVHRLIAKMDKELKLLNNVISQKR